MKYYRLSLLNFDNLRDCIFANTSARIEKELLEASWLSDDGKFVEITDKFGKAVLRWLTGILDHGYKFNEQWLERRLAWREMLYQIKVEMENNLIG